MYLAHHELESIVVVFNIITVFIITIVIAIAGECVGIRLCWHFMCCGCTGNGQCNILAGDILADVLCLQLDDHLPVAAPMHVVIQQTAAFVSFHKSVAKRGAALLQGEANMYQQQL